MKKGTFGATPHLMACHRQRGIGSAIAAVARRRGPVLWPPATPALRPERSAGWPPRPTQRRRPPAASTTAARTPRHCLVLLKTPPPVSGPRRGRALNAPPTRPSMHFSARFRRARRAPSLGRCPCVRRAGTMGVPYASVVELERTPRKCDCCMSSRRSTRRLMTRISCRTLAWSR